jgi:hypothetical protein
VELSWPCCNYGVPSLAASDRAVYAGTWGGGVFRSDDDGATWYATGTIPNEGYPLVIGLAACRYGETVYAGGQFGVVRSTDGGTNWEAISDGLPASWVWTLALRGTDLYARLNENIYRFDPETESWSAWEEGLSSTLGMQSIGATGDALFLSTHEGGVYHLDCNDSAWVAMNDGLWDDNVDAVVEVDQRLYAGLMGGGVWRWDPSVPTWGEVNTGLWNKDVRVMGKSGLSPLAGTWGAGVFKVDPETDEWAPAGTGIRSPFVTSLVTDASKMYAGLEGGGIYVSADQGDTWTHSISGLNNMWVWALAKDASGVYAGTWNGVCKSTDQGLTWSESGLQGDGVFSLIASGTALYAGRYGGHVYTSTNGGTSWTEVGTGLPAGNVQGLARLGTTTYAALWEQGVYKLPDGQTVWTAMNTGLPEPRMRSMTTFAGSLFLGTESKGVYKWNGGAARWDSCGPENGTVWSFGSVGNQLLAGTWGKLFASADTGRTWVDEHGDIKPWLAVRALTTGPGYLYAGLQAGVVFRAPIALSGVEDGPDAEPELSIRALKTDPNPFGAGTRVSFRLEEQADVRLAVYDVSGRRVASLVSGELPAGPHEKIWDGKTDDGVDAGAGVYFIRLETGGKEITAKAVHVR